ncbi:MAG: hypothetical protein ACI4TX_04060 [Christensenellales bacterium]
MKKIVFNKTTTKGYKRHNIYIEKGVLIEKGTVIWSGNIVCGQSVLSGCELLPNNHIDGATILGGSVIGPFARIRATSVIGENCKIGNFVEIKNSIIGDGTKISHLTYVGDAEIGKCCNVGCGAVFCNYNGKVKQRCEVGNNVFIGSNVNLVAPLKIGDNCMIACATTITEDMPSNTFAIGRVRQENKENKYF